MAKNLELLAQLEKDLRAQFKEAKEELKKYERDLSTNQDRLLIVDDTLLKLRANIRNLSAEAKIISLKEFREIKESIEESETFKKEILVKIASSQILIDRFKKIIIPSIRQSLANVTGLQKPATVIEGPWKKQTQKTE